MLFTVLVDNHELSERESAAMLGGLCFAEGGGLAEYELGNTAFSSFWRVDG